MFEKMSLASIIAGAFLLAPFAIPSSLAMPRPSLGFATSDVVTEVRYGHHGFRGGRRFGGGSFGHGHHRRHYGYSPYYSYGYAPRYYSYGSYYRPHFSRHSYYGYGGGYGHGYGW